MENWIDIEGYEGYYQVSDHGQIRSLDRYVPHKTLGKQFVKGKILALNPDSSGHLQTIGNKMGISKRLSVHKLVGKYFVEGDQSLWVLHKDDDKSNNHYTNLYWGTGSDNQKDSVRNFTHKEVIKTHCPQGHILKEPNIVTQHFEKHGKRRCWSCAKAHDWKRYHDEDFKLVSDRYYDSIRSQIDIV